MGRKRAEKATHCRRGHDRTLPGALYASGACRACEALRKVEYNAIESKAFNLARATERAEKRREVTNGGR